MGPSPGHWGQPNANLCNWVSSCQNTRETLDREQQVASFSLLISKGLCQGHPRVGKEPEQDRKGFLPASTLALCCSQIGLGERLLETNNS